MTSPNGRPRHLGEGTAEQRAIPTPPRHARPDTGELRARPARPVPLWAHEDGTLHAQPPARRHVMPRGLRGPSWWQRLSWWLRL